MLATCKQKSVMPQVTPCSYDCMFSALLALLASDLLGACLTPVKSQRLHLVHKVCTRPLAHHGSAQLALLVVCSCIA